MAKKTKSVIAPSDQDIKDSQKECVEYLVDRLNDELKEEELRSIVDSLQTQIKAGKPVFSVVDMAHDLGVPLIIATAMFFNTEEEYTFSVKLLKGFYGALLSANVNDSFHTMEDAIEQFEDDYGISSDYCDITPKIVTDYADILRPKFNMVDDRIEVSFSF